MLGLRGGDLMKNKTQAPHGNTSLPNITKYKGDNNGDFTVDKLSIHQPHEVTTVSPAVRQIIFPQVIHLKGPSIIPAKIAWPESGPR